MADKARPLRFDPARGAFPKVKAIGKKVAPHHDLYHFILSQSWGTFFGLISVSFFLANLVFAGLYSLQPGCIANARRGSFEDAFFFSVQTMATIGYGAMAPVTLFSHVVVTVEALCGMVGVALITGLTYAKFARPQARVLFSEKIVVANRDGVPHMMFRMANWRHNLILEAQARVIVLVLERTAEGETMRTPINLRLVRDRTATFFLTWTALHPIDETSPFYGAGALERLRGLEGTLFLTLSGLDETLGQTVHARYTYTLDDIVWNARFADVIEVLPNGTRVLNYHHFHQIQRE